MKHSRSTNLSGKKIAIVYDRVNKWGGAERVLLALNKIFPEAELFTSVYNPNTSMWASVFPKIHTSFLQRIPLSKSNHEFLAPLMPIAFEQINLSKYDLVISVTSEAAKGVITVPKTKHICICLTPTRYLWSGFDEYFNSSAKKFSSLPFVKYLRYWDRIAAQRPDKMIAISTEVQKRIKKYYDRDADIVYPPIHSSRINNLESGIKNKTNTEILRSALNDKSSVYYLVVSRLVSYKRVDLVIRTFNKLGRKLIIVGIGSEEDKLKRMAKDNIEFAGFVSEKKLVEYYTNAKALIFPQIEDFGLVALEAMNQGTPVIAYKAGGAQDTVRDGVNGVFFEKQSEESLTEVIERFELLEFDRNDIHKSIEKFSFEYFEQKLSHIIQDEIKNSE